MSVKVRIEIDEKALRALVVDYMSQQLGDLAPRPEQVKIEVKSKQNFKSEWEEAQFRAVYET